MSVIHAPHKPEIGFRQGIFLAAVGLALVGFLLRLWYLQVVRSSDLKDRAEALRRSEVQTLAPRGIIVDRYGLNNLKDGVLLAGIKPQVVITAVPNIVNKNPWVLDKLAGWLTQEQKPNLMPDGSTQPLSEGALEGRRQELLSKLQKRLNDVKSKPFLAAPIYVGVAPKLATNISENGDNFPGIGVETLPMRFYPDTTDFSHVLGYVWTPSEKDVARLEAEKVRPADYVGKIGVEYMYEKLLMGTPGSESIEVDSKSRPVRLVSSEAPKPGSSLVLTLDADLQKFTTKVLVDGIKEFDAAGGAAVALDPSTGEVLALASAPTYDTGLFLGGISEEAFQALSEDPQKPLTNRAIAGQYSPGSTFKLVTTIAAYRAGVLDTGRYVNCPGYYQIGNKKFKCLSHHGEISFYDAVAKSCNTYFSDLAVRTKRDTLRQTALDFGLGLRTGIDLRGEHMAVVPTDKWLRLVGRVPADKAPPWFPGDTVNMGIGQGYVSATPLQMAEVASMVANGGTNYKPHLVLAMKEPGANGKFIKTQPEELKHIDVPPQIWHELKTALVGVIDHGTARKAQIPGIVWAGKTGSTEHTGQASASKRTHSWFVGFAPADNPKIAIAVVFESAGHGGEVAAPVAASIVRHYLLAPKGGAARAAKTSPNSFADSSAQDAPAESPSFP